MSQQIGNSHQHSIPLRAGRDGRFVLFASPATSESTEALRAAEALAQAFTAELVVLRVTASTRGAPWRSIMSYSTVAKRTRKWCEDVLARRLRRDQVRTRAGDFLSIVAEAARQAGTELVVIPNVSGQTAGCVHDLAVEIGAPVLLFREVRGSDAVVVATDLITPGYPVLRTGALLSSSLRKRVVFVHNLRLTLASPSYWSVEMERMRSECTVRRVEQLFAVGRSFDIESTNVVTARATPAEAVLSVAERERADIIVVGARGRSRSAGGHAPAAQEIIERNPRSVLIVPL
jgi:nucleotide-binding universal stress UspA family protein